MKIPYFAIRNDELAKMPELKDEVLCPRCGKMHKVKYGKRILENGTKITDRTLVAVRCQGKLLLVGVKGKDITLQFRKH